VALRDCGGGEAARPHDPGEAVLRDPGGPAAGVTVPEGRWRDLLRGGELEAGPLAMVSLSGGVWPGLGLYERSPAE
jgi:hypothetical protein